MHPVEDILRRKFGKIKRASGGYVRIPCPLCDPHDAKKMKRYVHLARLSTRCFICEKPLSFFELTGSDIRPTYSGPMEKKEEHPWAKKIPCLGDPIPINQLPADHPAIKFLNKDHLYDIDHYAKDLGMIYVPVDKGVIFNRNPWTTSAERLVFPIFMHQQMVGWQMRSIPGTFYGDRPEVLKYYHLFDKGEALYQYDSAKKASMVVVVEGVKKSLKFPNAVATFGKCLSDSQLQLIQTTWSKITLMLDGEDETQAYARELSKKLNAGMTMVRNIDLRRYGYKSPDEAPAEALHRIVYATWNS